MTGKRFVAELREAALKAERYTRAVEQHGGLEALAQQARGLEQVDQADGAFECHGVERDERLFSGLGFDVFEDLLLVVDQVVTFLVRRGRDLGHSSPPGAVPRRCAAARMPNARLMPDLRPRAARLLPWTLPSRNTRKVVTRKISSKSIESSRALCFRTVSARSG